MPALKFWRQTQLNFLSAISITYSNTLQHCQLFQPFTQKKKKREKRNKERKISPYTIWPLSPHHMVAENYVKHTFLWWEERKLKTCMTPSVSRTLLHPRRASDEKQKSVRLLPKSKILPTTTRTERLQTWWSKCAPTGQARTWAAQKTKKKNAQDAKQAPSAGRAQRVRCLEKLGACNSSPAGAQLCSWTSTALLGCILLETQL